MPQASMSGGGAECALAVPVKISERCKPPPRHELGRAARAADEAGEASARARAALQQAEYAFRFESAVLGKLHELRAAKVTVASERRHRLRLLEEAKLRRLDELAAAEAEERLKQLSVEEVSYPSAEDIGDVSPGDDDDQATEEPIALPELAPRNDILQPVQLSVRTHRRDLLDDPDPLKEIQMNAKNSRYLYRKPDVDALTFSDFENDTSSPFDNMELKTINDLEQLAQVLQNSKDTGASNDIPANNLTAAPTPVDYNMMTNNCAIPGNVYLSTNYGEQPIVSHSNPNYGSPQHYTVPNQYYMNNDNLYDNTMPIENNLFTPNYRYYTPSNMYCNTQPVDGFYGSVQTATTQSDMTYPMSQVPINEAMAYAPQTFNFYNYPNVSTGYNQCYNTVQNGDVMKSEISASASRSTIKSRSRSVPDIVKELGDEVASERLRSRERSHNASPAPPSGQATPSSSVVNKISLRRSDKLPNPYDKLTPDMQEMCRNINSMGFPLDRVARMCQLLGDSDKKVIDGLLLMGQLMDLGFSESKVSAALVKHEFDRDKALDELVS